MHEPMGSGTDDGGHDEGDAAPRSRPEVSPVRATVAVAGTALSAALAALLLGEYDFGGSLPWLAGPVLGIVLAEVALAISGGRPRWLGPVAGVLAGASLVWAVYIATGEGLEPLPGSVWPAAVLAVVAATVWIGGMPVRWTRR